MLVAQQLAFAEHGAGADGAIPSNVEKAEA